MLTSLLKTLVGAAVRANGLGRRGGGGDDGCCCRHWRRGGRTPDGNVRARYVVATERMVPLVIGFSTIIYGASAVYDRTRKHGPTLKDADDDRLLSLSLYLTGFVVAMLPTGEKESGRAKQNGGNGTVPPTGQTVGAAFGGKPVSP